MLTPIPERTSVQWARPFPTQTSVSRINVAEYQDKGEYIAGKESVHRFRVKALDSSAGDSNRKVGGSSRGRRSDGAQLWQGGQLPENPSARSHAVSTWLLGRRKTSELCPPITLTQSCVQHRSQHHQLSAIMPDAGRKRSHNEWQCWQQGTTADEEPAHTARQKDLRRV